MGNVNVKIYGKLNDVEKLIDLCREHYKIAGHNSSATGKGMVRYNLTLTEVS